MQLKYFILKSLNRNQNKGFTLIELLVVIIIIGILSAIALPSFLNQTSKAKQVSAKTTISTVNSAQNAFRVENESFAPDMAALALGLPTDTTNYKFDIVGNQDKATIVAISKDSALKGYVGGVVRYGIEGQSAIATIVCQSKTASITPPILPTLDSTQTTPETAAKCDASQEKL
jgi:type IV pilus assembly protein PilA